MAFRAKLDADRIFRGIEEVDELAPGDVEVPPACDLKPGWYRWNAAEKTFDALPPHQRKGAEDVVDSERALYEFWKVLHERGEPLPQHTLEWCVAWETSFDGITGAGIDRADARGAFDYFRVALGILKAKG